MSRLCQNDAFDSVFHFIIKGLLLPNTIDEMKGPQQGIGPNGCANFWPLYKHFMR